MDGLWCLNYVPLLIFGVYVFRHWPSFFSLTFASFHHLTFARAGGHSSVYDDTVFFSAPSCELGHVLRDVLLRVHRDT